MSTWNEEHARVLAALKDLADERGKKSSAERDRSINLKREGDFQKGEMAFEHAWALENQERGLWEAYYLVLQHEPSDAGEA